MDQQRDKDKKDTPGSQDTWQWTSNELSKALSEWQTLSTQAPPAASDKKMLTDMQNLLKELKTKIDELSKD